MFEVNSSWISFISSLNFSYFFIYNDSQDNLATIAWGFAFSLFTLPAHASHECCARGWFVFFFKWVQLTGSFMKSLTQRKWEDLFADVF